MPPDRTKALQSLKVAQSKLVEAEKLAEAGFENVALVSAYASMFHSGRAILFKEGIVEKSHYCLVMYLKENYATPGKIDHEIITLMDAFREERHEVLYSLEGIGVKATETKTALETARKLLGTAKHLVG